MDLDLVKTPFPFSPIILVPIALNQQHNQVPCPFTLESNSDEDLELLWGTNPERAPFEEPKNYNPDYNSSNFEMKVDSQNFYGHLGIEDFLSWLSFVETFLWVYECCWKKKKTHLVVNLKWKL